MNNEVAISVLILNWNGKEFLKPLLDSIRRQTIDRGMYEVVVADNNSSDNSVDYIKKQYPEVRIVLNKKNYGYAEGNNLGIDNCRGRYILVLNTDTKIDKDMLKELYKTIESEKMIGAVVPLMYYMDKSKVICNAGSELTGQDWPVREIGTNQIDSPEYHNMRDISAFCGGAVLLNREMLDKVGLFDSDFFLYFEDSDLSWRGQKQGWKYKINPKAVVYHVSKGSTGGEESKTFQYYVPRNRLLILFKNGSPKNIIRAIAKTILYNVAHPLWRVVVGKDRAINRLRFLSGVKALSMALIYFPKMLMKRYGIISERKLS